MWSVPATEGSVTPPSKSPVNASYLRHVCSDHGDTNEQFMLRWRSEMIKVLDVYN